MASGPTWNSTLASLNRTRIGGRHRATYRLNGPASWSLLAFVIVAITFAVAHSENKYPGALVGAFIFFLVQWILPACRPVSGKLICPWNWALWFSSCSWFYFLSPCLRRAPR